MSQAAHPVGRWFRPIVAVRLAGEGIHTLGELVALVNSAPVFAYLRAAHDLDTVRAYLHRYDDRPATRRAYTRELERPGAVVRGRARHRAVVDASRRLRGLQGISGRAG